MYVMHSHGGHTGSRSSTSRSAGLQFARVLTSETFRATELVRENFRIAIGLEVERPLNGGMVVTLGAKATAIWRSNTGSAAI